jgi:signal transduction histidine kinase
MSVKINEPGTHKTYTILVVDDNPTNLGVVTSYLKAQGFGVLIARDGKSGIARARYARPDLILLDVLMPGIDGFEMCRRLKMDEQTRGIPVIFMTALTATEDKIKGFRAGAVDYITKPLQEQEVLARVETHLRLRELNEYLEQMVRARTYELSIAVEEARRLNQQLQREIAENKRAEEELKLYRDHLEELVEQRTQELREAQEELLHRERLSALGQLTAALAHEIRNPLGTVRTCVFAIGDAIESQQSFESLSRTTERLERAMQMAERNILRCDNIIQELLDYTNDQALHPRLTELDAWLEALLDELTLPQDVVCSRELKAGVSVSIDRERLHVAVVNVVKNALDALQEQEGPDKSLAISTRVVAERVEMCFSDNGPGIPGDVLPRVFEPLFSTKGFGVGLGLPIAKNIMEQHRGGVNVQSTVADDEQPRGTSVVLWLPVDSERAK